MLSVVFLFVSSLAQTAGISRQLADSGIVLLFETNNVTLSGAADFYLNGERFKSAEVTYKQAGTDSFWDLQLKTPREYRTDRETGFIIIANDENVYVMERYHPGIYSDGSVYPCETLIRRSTRSDILVAAARVLAAYFSVSRSFFRRIATINSSAAKAAAIRIMTIASANWARNLFQSGVFFSSPKELGPYFSSLAAASALVRPLVSSELSSLTTCCSLFENDFTKVTPLRPYESNINM
jgi:hypothetical protein